MKNEVKKQYSIDLVQRINVILQIIADLTMSLNFVLEGGL